MIFFLKGDFIDNFGNLDKLKKLLKISDFINKNVEESTFKLKNLQIIKLFCIHYSLSFKEIFFEFLGISGL